MGNSRERLQTDFLNAINNLNIGASKLAGELKKFAKLAAEINAQTEKVYATNERANAQLLDVGAKEAMAAGVEIANNLINRSANAEQSINAAANELDNFNMASLQFVANLQKVGLFSGTPAPTAGAKSINAELVESISQYENQNALELQMQITNLVTLMKTERITFTDKKQITKIDILIAELDSSLKVFHEKGHEFKNGLTQKGPAIDQKKGFSK